MTWEHVTHVQSDSKPGHWYEIKRRTWDGLFGCSCIAYRFAKGDTKTCKHIQAYRADPLTAAFAGASSQVSVIRSASETFTFRRAISFGGKLGA